MVSVTRRRTKTRSLPGTWASNSSFIALIVLVVVAIAFGGGGSPSPASELVVQLAAIGAVVLAIVFDPAGNTGHPVGGTLTRTRVMWGLVLVWVALFAMQLVPLPAEVWQSFGGRKAMADALALLGDPDTAWPISIEPRATLVSLLSLIPPIAVVYLVGRTGTGERDRVLAAVVVMGLLAALIGAVQISSGAMQSLRFYAETHYGVITGFQANRNAAADVFLIALIAAAGLHVSIAGRSIPRDGRATAFAAARIASMVVLAIAILLTASRTGMALLAATLASLALWALMQVTWNRRSAGIAVIGVLFLGVAAFALASNDVLGHGIWTRIMQGAGERSLMWEDARYIAGLVWPWGSGIGTFQTIFVANEQLEAVTLTVPNRAHNDYLELAIEAGLPGLALLVISLGFLAWCTFAPRGGARDSIDIGHRIFAGGTIIVVALHSIVEYPIRSMSVACLTALAGALVCSFALPNKSAEDNVAS